MIFFEWSQKMHGKGVLIFVSQSAVHLFPSYNCVLETGTKINNWNNSSWLSYGWKKGFVVANAWVKPANNRNGPRVQRILQKCPSLIVDIAKDALLYSWANVIHALEHAPDLKYLAHEIYWYKNTINKGLCEHLNTAGMFSTLKQ